MRTMRLSRGRGWMRGRGWTRVRGIIRRASALEQVRAQSHGDGGTTAEHLSRDLVQRGAVVATDPVRDEPGARRNLKLPIAGGKPRLPLEPEPVLVSADRVLEPICNRLRPVGSGIAQARWSGSPDSPASRARALAIIAGTRSR